MPCILVALQIAAAFFATGHSFSPKQADGNLRREIIDSNGDLIRDVLQLQEHAALAAQVKRDLSESKTDPDPQTAPAEAAKTADPVLVKPATTAPEEAVKTAPEEAAKTAPEDAAETAPEEAAKTAPEEVAKTAPEEAAETAPEEVAKTAEEPGGQTGGTLSDPKATPEIKPASSNTTDASSAIPKPWYATMGFLAHAMVYVVLFEIIACAAFEYYHRQWANPGQGDDADDLGYEVSRSSLGRMFQGMSRLISPYFKSIEGALGRAYVVAILCLGVLALFLLYVHNLWQKEWWDLFQSRNAAEFPYLLGVYGSIVIAFAMTNTYSTYLRSMLYIKWREWMTHRLSRRWLSSHAHFLLGLNESGQEARVDNPDQRIQEDIHLFVNSTINILGDAFDSFGILVVFMPVVYFNEPPKAFGMVECRGWLLLIVLFWALLGSLATHFLGWRLIGISFARQRAEADLRRTAMHVRENGESVALYNSESSEEASMRDQFGRIRSVQWQQMAFTKRLSFFTSAYNFTQFMIPFMVLAPSYFNHEISLGGLFQLTGAIGKVSDALSWFVLQYHPLTDWRATADRLLIFEDAITAVQVQGMQAAAHVKYGLEGATGKPTRAAAGADSGNSDSPSAESFMVQANIGEVRLPTGEALWRNIKLDVQPGQKVLISGPEGIGKSVLFKALAGIWPYVDGGCVQLPVENASEVLFVPQRPALPKQATLAQALAYPELRSAYSNSEMAQALRDVKMLEFLGDGQGGRGPSSYDESRPGSLGSEGVDSSAATAEIRKEGGRKDHFGLDAVDDWSTRLSPGQQQRLAIGHVLLKRPRVLFLDEATSNLSKEAAIELYRMITLRMSDTAAIVSISHDIATLAPLHDLHYIVEGDGDANTLKMQKTPPVDRRAP